MIAVFKEKSAEYNFNETQNIIIIATDGIDTVLSKQEETPLDPPSFWLCSSTCRFLQHWEESLDCSGQDPNSAGLPQHIPGSH